MTNAYDEFHHRQVINSLPEPERTRLLKETIHKKLNKGQSLTCQGDVWPYVMFVITGQIRWAMLVTSGKEHILFNIEENK